VDEQSLEHVDHGLHGLISTTCFVVVVVVAVDVVVVVVLVDVVVEVSLVIALEGFLRDESDGVPVTRTGSAAIVSLAEGRVSCTAMK